MTLIDAVRIGLKGDEHVGGWHGGEACGENADHGVWVACEEEGFSQQRGVAAQPRFPEVVADDGSLCATGQIFLGKKSASERRHDAEDMEIILGNMNSMHLLGAVAGP